jgi:hypothetical protein
VGGVLGDLNLEGLDAAQMDDLGGVTDEILAENEVSDSGEDNMDADSEDDDVSFSGRGTQNPVAPEFKAGDRVVYLGERGDEMHLGYYVTVHGDREGGGAFIHSKFGRIWWKTIEGQCLSLLLLKRSLCPMCPFQCHTTPPPGPLKPRKTNMPRRNT